MPITMPGTDAFNLLESGVISPGAEQLPQVTVNDSHISLSIAVSQKRIANSLEHLANAFHPSISDAGAASLSDMLFEIMTRTR